MRRVIFRRPVLFLLAALCAALLFTGCGSKKAVTAAALENGSSAKSYSSARTSPSSSRADSSSAVSQTNTAGSSSPASQPKTAAQHIVCLDPGHQKKVDLSTEPLAPGSSIMKVKNPGGATGVATGLPEYALNMTIADQLRVKLEQAGYKVIMTRTDNDADISNVGRAEVANHSGAEIFVRIHADSVDDSSVHGISVLIPGDEYLTDPSLLQNSRRLGNDLLGGLTSSTGAKNRGLSVRSDMTGFNWSKVPVALAEMGFLSNPDEDRTMSTPDYQAKLVDGFVDGINRYFQESGT